MIAHASGIGRSSPDRRVTVGAAAWGCAVGAALIAFQAFAQEPRIQEPRIEPPASVGSVPAVALAPAAQPPTSQPPAAQPPAAQPPNLNYQPGFIDVFGRFIGDSAAKFNSQFKSANQTLGDIGNQTTDAAKDAVGNVKSAADSIIGLPNARIVTGRERCAAAPNGAPDCRAAADAACRSKGFASGRSLDTQSARKCPARVWLSGHLPADGECALETFVTRAVCQ
jgi:hypothetical protein